MFPPGILMREGCSMDRGRVRKSGVDASNTDLHSKEKDMHGMRHENSQ